MKLHFPLGTMDLLQTYDVSSDRQTLDMPEKTTPISKIVDADAMTIERYCPKVALQKA